jgi:hypothetical protein
MCQIKKGGILPLNLIVFSLVIVRDNNNVLELLKFLEHNDFASKLVTKIINAMLVKFSTRFAFKENSN